MKGISFVSIMRRLPVDNLRSPAAMMRFGLTMGIGLGLDLWTKWLSIIHLYESGREIEFIRGWLHFKYVENHGAVFGIGQGQRWFFVIVSVAAILFLTYLFLTSRRQWLYQIILGMLLAGVLGNMYDRIFYGYVRDMIYVFAKWGIFPWVFNIADSLLCVGVAMLVGYSFLQSPESQEESRREVEPV